MLIGLDAQLARDASFYAFFFGGYEVFTYMFRTHVPSMPDELNYFLRYVRIVSDEMHIHEMYVHIMYDSHIYILWSISGGFAGMLGWTLAMPFDVPKTNVQARYDTRVVGSCLPELIRIAKQRGIIGLYSGLAPTLVRAFPANAALFLGVETGKKIFDRYVWDEE